MNYWEKEDVEYLSNNYEKMFYSDIATNLGRTYSSVSCKARKLDLKTNLRYKQRQFKYNDDYFKIKKRKIYSPRPKKKKCSLTLLLQLII